MAQLGYSDGVNLDPKVVDHLMKIKDKNYKKTRAEEILDQLEAAREKKLSPEYQQQQRDMRDTNPLMDLMPAFAKAGAQIGNVGGQVADTSAVDDMSKAIEKRRNEDILFNEKAAEERNKYDEFRLKKASYLDDIDEKERQREFDLGKEERKRKSDLEIEKTKQGGSGDKLSAYATTVQGVDEQGNPVTNVLNKRGEIIRTIKTPVKLAKEKEQPKTYEDKVLNMNGEVRKRYDFTTMGLSSMLALNDALLRGDNTVRPVGENEFTYNRNLVSEAIGRMHSGGAINNEELATFKGFLPTFKDTDEVKAMKIKTLLSLFSNRVARFGIDPYVAAEKEKEVYNKFTKALKSKEGGFNIYGDSPSSSDNGTAYAAPGSGVLKHKEGDDRMINGQLYRRSEDGHWDPVEEK